MRDQRAYRERVALIARAELHRPFVVSISLQGQVPKFYFWRDSSGREIDLLTEKGGSIQRAIEIKASATYNPKFFGTLDVLGESLGIPPEAREVVYSGDDSMETRHGLVHAFANLP